MLAELPAPPEEAWSQEEVQWRIRQWEQHQLLSDREAAIVRFFMAQFAERLDDEERGRLLRNLLQGLADLPRGEEL